MIPALRARFNREWTPARHEALLARLTARVGAPAVVAQVRRGVIPWVLFAR